VTRLHPPLAVRTLLATALIAVLAGLTWLVFAPKVAACSCAQMSMADLAAQPDVAVFSGQLGGRDARGYPVAVTRWFHGPGLAPVVWLDPAMIRPDGGGGDCSIPPLEPGEWLLVGYPSEQGLLSVSLCSPHAQLGQPDGNRMLAEAITAFGEPVIASPPVAEPAAPPAARPGVDATVVLIAIVLAVVSLFGGVVLVAMRGRARKV
jgi:hypothetical protein